VTRGILFLVFLVKPKMSKKHEMSQMSQIRSTYRFLFRHSANMYVSKLRFAVVWLEQIHNLDTGHVYVLGLRSGTTLTGNACGGRSCGRRSLSRHADRPKSGVCGWHMHDNFPHGLHDNFPHGFQHGLPQRHRSSFSRAV